MNPATAPGAAGRDGGLMRRYSPVALASVPALLLVLTVACTCGGPLGPACPTPGPSPTPVPTPTPGPTPTPPPGPLPAKDQYVYPENLLRVDGTGLRLTKGGNPTILKGISECCDNVVAGASGRVPLRRPKPIRLRRVTRTPPENANKFGAKATVKVEIARVLPSRWPSMSVEIQDYFHGFGADRNQVRIAPYLTDADHEVAWQDIGGPYLPGSTTINQPWWDENRRLIHHWNSLGGTTEVNSDSWWFKFCDQNGTQNCAWPDAEIRSWGNTFTPLHAAFIDKQVEEFGCIGGVTWGVGNEEALVPHANAQFFARVRDEYRAAEGRHPCKQPNGQPVVVVHMISNDAPEWVGAAPYDIATTHTRAPLTQAIAGLPTELNEFNPGWPPQEWFANYCKSQAAGLSTWLWRNGSTDQEFEQMLSLMARGCGVVPEQCFVPAGDDPNWGANVACAGQMLPYLKQAEAIVGDRTGVSKDEMYQTNALLAAELRKMKSTVTGKPLCASGPWGDATAILNEDGTYTEEHHAVAYTDGGYTTNPAVLPKFCWVYNGGPIQPPQTSCDIDPGVTDRIDCKLQQPTTYLYDCTPKVHGSPVLPEGDPRRSACETKAGGGTPTFSVDPATGLSIQQMDNPYQFKLKGAGSGQLHCTLPNSAPNDLCHSLPVSR